MNCDCITKVNEKLKDLGVRIKQQLMVNLKTGTTRLDGPFVTMEKAGSKKPLPSMSCVYCPFCGKKRQE